VNAKEKLHAKHAGTEKTARYIPLEAAGPTGDVVPEATATAQTTAGQEVAARVTMMTMNNPGREIRANRQMIETAQIERMAFETNGDRDLFTGAGLTTQIVYGPGPWRIVVAKELTDNALDVCESEYIALELGVTLGPNLRHRYRLNQ
jgi:hypothetical protein